MSALRLHVRATGLVSPVGLSAAAACAAMRADISLWQALPYRSNRRKPVDGSWVEALPLELGRRARLVDLLAMAVVDALRGVQGSRLEEVPLLVAVAEPERPASGADMAGELVSRVEQRLEQRFLSRLSRVVEGGNAAGFKALGLARALLAERRVRSCLVCGVDSFIHARALLWLEQTGRLKAETNQDGVLPGEAAACVWVEERSGAERPTLATVTGLGFAQEPAPLLSDKPLRAEGLVKATRQALKEAGAGMEQVDWRLSDVAGESYAFKEQSLAVSRLLRVKKEELPLWLPAESLGEVGAASGLCQLVWAAQAFERGYAVGGRALCCTSSVGGERATAVVEGQVKREEERR
jgi:3-oxoacyl-[acyl-carrier-protein] synthase I